MSDTNAAAPAAGDTTLSARDAAARMSAPAPEEKPKNLNDDVRSVAAEVVAEREQPEQDSPQGETGADDTGRPTGETEAPDADNPPIGLPKSWAKELEQAFSALPREAQQAIASRERARDAEISRRLEETAKRAKSAEEAERAAHQSRQQYESALPQLLQSMQQQIAGEFADIKSWADVATMQEKDPLRFQRWQVVTAQTQQASQEAEKVRQQQTQEQQKRFKEYVAEQGKKFAELAPEFFDPKTSTAKQAEVRALLTDVGVSQDELTGLWAGQPISIHDHRLQVIIAKAARWDAAEKARKAAKPVTAVPQKPGTASTKGEARTEQARLLHERLNRTGSVKDAVAILNMRRG